MDDLARWLTAQLDIDERIARAVEDRSAPWDGQWMADGNSAVRTFNGHVLFYRHGSGPLKPGLADHVAEWGPARVLREIEADREMLAEYERLLRAHAAHKAEAARMARAGDDDPFQGAALRREADYLPAMVHVLERWAKRKAAVFADRPGYREEWRP